jgi:hypothetical protein
MLISLVKQGAIHELPLPSKDCFFTFAGGLLEWEPKPAGDKINDPIENAGWG